jgi:hypothetical protein
LSEVKEFLVNGVLVEAVKSEGGSFYDIRVVATGDKQRYLAKVFEKIAKPVWRRDDSRISTGR